MPNDEIGFLESLSKSFAVALGVVYVFGFVVVASYLSRFGVSSFSALHLQYLVAGIWLLAPPTIFSCLTLASERFDARAAPDVPGRFNWRRVAVANLLTTLPSGLFFGLLASVPNVVENLTWGTGIRFFLFNMVMMNLVQLFWISLKIETSRETWWRNRAHAAPFYFSFPFVIVTAYAVWFSVRLYPLIPFSMGGGRPLSVSFIEGDKNMPDEIQRSDKSSKRSIAYKLLFSTDKYYVVVSPSPKERSIEISRDSVAGMVVIE